MSQDAARAMARLRAAWAARYRQAKAKPTDPLDTATRAAQTQPQTLPNRIPPVNVQAATDTTTQAVIKGKPVIPVPPRQRKVFRSNLPESPFYDQLRATPGTLENAMAQIDARAQLNDRDRQTVKTFLSESGKPLDENQIDMVVRTIAAQGTETLRNENRMRKAKRNQPAIVRLMQGDTQIETLRQAIGETANQVVDQNREMVNQTATLVEDLRAKSPLKTGLIRPELEAAIDAEKDPNIRLNARIVLETLKTFDPTESAAFLKALTQHPEMRQNVAQIGKQMQTSIADGFIKGDEKAVAAAAGMVLGAMTGAVTPGMFKTPRLSPNELKRLVRAAQTEAKLAPNPQATRPQTTKRTTPPNIAPEATRVPNPPQSNLTETPTPTNPPEINPTQNPTQNPNLPSPPAQNPDTPSVNPVRQTANDNLGGIIVDRQRPFLPGTNERIDVETRIVERSQIQASHNEILGKNPKYVAELQPRDRASKGSQAQILAIAQNLDPDQLLEQFNSTDKGPPVIGMDGMVESGNGRILALDIAQQSYRNRREAYRQKLIQKHPEAANMENPVLVNVRIGDTGDIDLRRKVAEASNARTAAAQNDYEVAKLDAQEVPDDLLTGLKSGRGDLARILDTKQNEDIVRDWFNTFPTNERVQYITADGDISNRGLNRLAKALMAKALGKEGDDLLRDLYYHETINQEVKIALERNTPTLLKLRARADAGETLPLEALKGIANGIKYMREAQAFQRRGKGPAVTWFDQPATTRRDPNGLRIGRMLIDPTQYGDMSSTIGNIARVTETADGGLFADELGLNSLTDILDAAENAPKVAEDLDLFSFDDAPQSDIPNRRNRQAGFVDLRILKAVAATSVVGAVALSPQFRDYMRDMGVQDITNMALISGGIAAVHALGKRARKGASTRTFAIDRAILDPKALATKFQNGIAETDRAFGEAVSKVLNARATYVYRSGLATKQFSNAIKQTFGPKWDKDPVFREWNAKLRDHMETNVAAGRNWHDALPPQVKTFVERVKPILDEVLDEWEDLGGRVAAKLDQDTVKLLQQMQSQSNVTVRYSGQIMTLDGFEYRDIPYDPNDPFTPYLPDGKTRTDTPDMILKDDNGNSIRVSPGANFGRPVNRLGEAFVPRAFRGDFIDVLKRLRNNKTAVLDAVQRIQQGGSMADILKDLKGKVTAEDINLAQAMRDALVNQNPYSGLSGDAMLGELLDVDDAFQLDQSNLRTYLANLEQARTWELAKFTYRDANGQSVTVDPYENRYLDAITRYLDRAWLRVAVADQLGVVSSAPAELVNAARKADVRYGDYIEQLFGLGLGIGPRKPNVDAATNINLTEGAYQAVTKLTGGSTIVSQLGDLQFALTETGFRNFFPAIAKGFQGDGPLADDILSIEAAAGVREAYVQALKLDNPDNIDRQPKRILAKNAIKAAREGQVGVASALFTSAIMAVAGIRATDRSVRRIAIASIVNDAQRLISKDKPLTAAEQRRLDQYGINDNLRQNIRQASTTGNPVITDNPEAMAKLGAAARRLFTYSGDATDYPLWMANHYGPIITRFKKPMYMVTRYAIERVYTELQSGNVAFVAKFLATSLALGAAQQQLRSLIRLEGWSEEQREAIRRGDWKNLVQSLMAATNRKTAIGKALDPAQNRNAFNLLEASATALYDGGSLGLMGELLPTNPDNTDLTGTTAPDPWSLAAPITATELAYSLREYSRTFRANDRDQKDLAKVDPDLARDLQLQRLATTTQNQLARSVTLARRAMTIAGIRTPMAELELLNRKERKQPLTTAELRRQFELQVRIYGRANTIRKIKRKATPKVETPKDILLDSVGFNADGTKRDD